MQIKLKNYNPNKYMPKYMQEGGEMPAPAEPAAPEAQAAAPAEDPMQQILAAAQQALEQQDCNLAMQVLQAILQMAGATEVPPTAPGEPVYRKGGKLVRFQ